LDGFNPLVIKEIRFTILDEEKQNEILEEYLGSSCLELVGNYLSKPFTPGELMVFLKEEGIELKGDSEKFIGDLLGISRKNHDTGYGEGYWSDHWTYNLDLLENYLAVYPEKKDYLLFQKKNFSFYDNPHCVQARDDKYVLWDGKPMQLNAVVYDEEKELLINSRSHDPNKVRMENGQGEIYFTNLFSKMLSLIVNKLASLDAEGVGVEMESGKPNWYDALNGLPGLMGSSISETLEVKRHILFLLKAIDESSIDIKSWELHEELLTFLACLHEQLKSDLSPFDFWDKATSIKESYRAKIRLGISGKENAVSTKEIVEFLEAGLEKLEAGIKKAWNKKDDVISTYFMSEVVEYEKIYLTSSDGSKEEKLNDKGQACFKVKKFKHHALPLFLEGPVHYLRSNKDEKHAAEFAKNIKASGLFDKDLKMYKVNASLNSEPMEIGRARTFSPGWFENESIWMHMEYKYMLELLRNELYTEFYQDFKNVIVPFMDPEVYGRSILENSSFIVSSANPDPSIHGNGFVARLSGATAEFINILMFMNVGKKPFSLNENGELQLQFNPALPGWLFTKTAQKKRLLLSNKWQDVEIPENSYSFMFLGDILVTYHNKNLKDTFGYEGVSPVTWKVFDLEGNSQTFQGNTLKGDIAEKIRRREILKIDLELE